MDCIGAGLTRPQSLSEAAATAAATEAPVAVAAGVGSTALMDCYVQHSGIAQRLGTASAALRCCDGLGQDIVVHLLP